LLTIWIPHREPRQQSRRAFAAMVSLAGSVRLIGVAYQGTGEGATDLTAACRFGIKSV
jgi:hypothetical protein